MKDMINGSGGGTLGTNKHMIYGGDGGPMPPIPGGYGNPTGVNQGNLGVGSGTSNGKKTGGLFNDGPGTVPGNTVGGNRNPFIYTILESLGLGNNPGNGASGGNPTPVPGTNDLVPPTNTPVSGTGGVPVPGNFTANTGTNSTSPNMNIDIASLLGLAGNNTNILSNLNNIFGGGIGDTLYNFLKSGAGYNANSTQALIDATKPNEERGRNNVLESFGAAGAGESSAAAIGLGDFESSYALGQNQILANQYNNAVDRYSNLFGGILNTAYDWKQNQLNTTGILNGILSALGGGSGLGALLSSLAGLIKGKGGSGSGGSGGSGGGGGQPGSKPSPIPPPYGSAPGSSYPNGTMTSNVGGTTGFGWPPDLFPPGGANLPGGPGNESYNIPTNEYPNVGLNTTESVDHNITDVNGDPIMDGSLDDLFNTPTQDLPGMGDSSDYSGDYGGDYGGDSGGDYGGDSGE